jgi:hypothetical protein
MPDPNEQPFLPPDYPNANFFDDTLDTSEVDNPVTPPALDPVASTPYQFPDSQFSQSHEDAPYTQFTIQSEFREQSGRLGIPVAGPPGTPAKMIQFHAPIQERVVRWTATRVGSIPELPSPNTGSSNEVLISKRIIPEAPKPYRSGNFSLFRVTGEYVYQILQPLVPGVDAIPSTASPATSASAPTNNLQNFMFKDGVIAPAISSGGVGGS